MKTYRNADFVRDRRCSNIVVVRGTSAPNDGRAWVECSEQEALEIDCMGLTVLYQQGGREYLGVHVREQADLSVEVLNYEDCLAHAVLADTLGHGIPPWVMLDDETREFAHELLKNTPDVDVGLRLLADGTEPEWFDKWLARERAALAAAAAITQEWV